MLRKTKKALSFVLSIIMIMSMFAGLEMTSVAAANIIASGTCHTNIYGGTPDGYVEWSLDSDGLLTITGNGSMETREDAWTNYWEEYSEQIKKVIVGEGVKNLSSGAFIFCKNLEEVQLPESLQRIESRAFFVCENLVSITIPKNVKYIEDEVFAWCAKLEEITFLCDSPEYVDASVFYESTAIKKINAPANASFITKDMLIGTALYEDKSNWTGDSLIIGNTLVALDENFSGDYVCPENVKNVAASAFSGCSQLTSVVLPDNLVVLENDLFSNCQALEKVVIPDSVKYIRNGVFLGCFSLKQIDLPAGLLEIGKYAFEGCTFTEIWLPESLKLLDDCAFSGCTMLEEIIIPASVEYLGRSLFNECNSLETMAVLSKNCDTGLGYDTLDDVYNNSGNMFFIPSDCFGIVPEQTTVYCYEASTMHVFCLVVDRTFSFDVAEYAEKHHSYWRIATSDISVELNEENKIATITQTALTEDIVRLTQKENAAVYNADGEKISDDTYIGTGFVVRFSDDQGNVTDEYTVVVPCDVDGNGEVTASDARTTLRASAGLSTVEGFYAMAADRDNNNELTASDARTILRKSAGLE